MLLQLGRSLGEGCLPSALRFAVERFRFLRVIPLSRTRYPHRSTRHLRIVVPTEDVPNRTRPNPTTCCLWPLATSHCFYRTCGSLASRFSSIPKGDAIHRICHNSSRSSHSRRDNFRGSSSRLPRHASSQNAATLRRDQPQLPHTLQPSAILLMKGAHDEHR
jgi:hypothetical protein